MNSAHLRCFFWLLFLGFFRLPPFFFFSPTPLCCSFGHFFFLHFHLPMFPALRSIGPCFVPHRPGRGGRYNFLRDRAAERLATIFAPGPPFDCCASSGQFSKGDWEPHAHRVAPCPHTSRHPVWSSHPFRWQFFIFYFFFPFVAAHLS